MTRCCFQTGSHPPQKGGTSIYSTAPGDGPAGVVHGSRGNLARARSAHAQGAKLVSLGAAVGHRDWCVAKEREGAP